MSDNSEEITKVLRKAWKIGIIQSVNKNITNKLNAFDLQEGQKCIILSKYFTPEISGTYAGQLIKKEKKPNSTALKLTFQRQETGGLKSHQLVVDPKTKMFLTLPDFQPIKELIDTSNITDDEDPDNINSQQKRDFEERLRQIKDRLEDARKSADQQAEFERQQIEQRSRMYQEKARKDAEQKQLQEQQREQAEKERLQREQEQKERLQREQEQREQEKRERLQIEQEQKERLQIEQEKREREYAEKQQREKEQAEQKQREEEERQTRLKLQEQQNQQNQQKLQQKTSPYPSLRETRRRGPYNRISTTRCRRNTMSRYCIPKGGCVQMVQKTWNEPCPKGYRRCADGVCYSMADGSPYIAK